ncbi:NB-ARC domain-containing protein [Actinoplanes sp. NBC_00393]|uniref:NB-ARC domain-containing protein n=1 Tax=Actinoplanes sp. NBC_00393 TaxID=2975953 RepID=UPI002E1FF450
MTIRRRRSLLAVVLPLGAVSTLLTAALAIAVNAATALPPPWPYGLEVLRRHPFESVAVINAALLIIGAVMLSLSHRSEANASDGPLPPAPAAVPGWVIERPTELRALIQQLTTGRTVGITTALHGAGGFGKTTLAAMVCRDRRVQKRFQGRIYRVTLGRDLRDRAAIASKVCDLAEMINGKRTALEDVRLAGEHLGRILDSHKPVLLVIDDVWDRAQLEPFLSGGAKCARLITTRSPSTLPEQAATVLVDQLSWAQARQMLTWELPPISSSLLSGLLGATGRWPLLLRLVNRMLVDLVHAGAVADSAAADVLARLRRLGPAAADPSEPGHVDLDEPEQRALAVQATIDASRSLLTDENRQRLAELAIFAEDEQIPVEVVLALWQATGGLDPVDGRRLCRRLADLALLQLSAHAGGHLSVHDVVRDFLMHELGRDQAAHLHTALLDAFRVPAAAAPPGTAPTSPARVPAWWTLPANARYLWDQLLWHLTHAGRTDEAETLATDLRWIGARLLREGPYAPLADLAAVGTPRADTARRALQQAAHLLAPTEPAHALVDVLHARMHGSPLWGEQAAQPSPLSHPPRLNPAWPLPDSHVQFDRVLDGNRATDVMAVAPNGQWWVSAGQQVRLWDTTRMQVRATLTGHRRAVRGVVIAPDSSWLATAGGDGAVGIWDAATGALRTWLRGHSSWVKAVAVTPDGERLVTAGGDGTVGVWNVQGGQCVAMLTGHRGAVHTATVAPDGDWFATAGNDATIRVWDATSLTERVVLHGHSGAIHQLIAETGGNGLISAGDRTVRGWDCATGRLESELVRHDNPVTGVAMPSHGQWIVTIGDGRLQMWDKSGRRLEPPTDRRPWVNAVAVFNDDDRLAIGYADDTVQIVDARPARVNAVAPPHAEPTTAVAFAPDGRIVGSAGRDGGTRLWAVSSPDLVTATDDVARALRFRPDGTAAVVGRTGVVIYDRLGRIVESCTVGVSPGESIDLALDGSWFAAVDAKHIRQYRVPYGAQINECPVDVERITTILAHPDGDRVVLGSADGLHQVHMASRRRLWSTPTRRVSALGIAPSGDLLVAGFVDGTLAAFDASTGTERWSTSRHPDAPPPDGHTSPAPRQVTAVAFAADGSWFAATDNDGSVRLWDAAAGRCLTMSRTDGPLSCCAVSADGQRVAVGGGRGITMFTVDTAR